MNYYFKFIYNNIQLACSLLILLISPYHTYIRHRVNVSVCCQLHWTHYSKPENSG